MVNLMPDYDHPSSIQEARRAHIQAVSRNQDWFNQLQEEEKTTAQQEYLDALARDQMFHELTRENWSLIGNVLQNEQQMLKISSESIQQVEQITEPNQGFPIT